MAILNNNIKKYLDDGLCILKLFNKKESIYLKNYAENWIYNLTKISKNDRHLYPINQYHVWSKKLNINHSQICNSKNRYRYPNNEIKKIIFKNQKILFFLNNIGINKHKIWDDGWGWLGFRLIRPKKNDGYPFSCKSWGIAKDVISFWCPVIGYTNSDTLSLIKKSNHKEYKNYLPKNSKFTQGEKRLSKKYTNLKIYNPRLNQGEVIIYSPRTLHSENNDKCNKTRFNLEFRINPHKNAL